MSFLNIQRARGFLNCDDGAMRKAEAMFAGSTADMCRAAIMKHLYTKEDPGMNHEALDAIMYEREEMKQELDAARTDGKKHDGGKPNYLLLPRSVLPDDEMLRWLHDRARETHRCGWLEDVASSPEEIEKVMAFGASKYSARGWETCGIEASRLLAAAMRHQWAIVRGEKCAKDSGLPHVWHRDANLAMLEDLDLDCVIGVWDLPLGAK